MKFWVLSKSTTNLPGNPGRPTTSFWIHYFMLNEMQTTQITDTLGQRIDYINWNTSNRIYIYPKLSNLFFSLSYIRVPSSPFSPLQPLMPFPSIPGSPIRCERKDNKTKNIIHSCWISYSFFSSFSITVNRLCSV